MVKRKAVKVSARRGRGKVATQTSATSGNLIAHLKKIRPALSKSDIVPVLHHFCFEGDRVYAYDDIAAMEIKLGQDTGLNCAVPGEVLIKVLSSFPADTKIILEESSDEQCVFIKRGNKKASTKIPYLGKDAFLFSRESANSELLASFEGDVVKSLVRAMETILFSCSANPSFEYQMGINVKVEEGSLTLITTDNTTISMVEVEIDAQEIEELDDFLIPWFFVNYISGMKDGDEFSIRVFTDRIEASDSNLLVVSRMPYSPSIEMLMGVIDRNLEDMSNFITVGAEVMESGITDRCSVVSQNELHRRAALTFTEGAVTFSAKGSFGEVDESFDSEYSGDDVSLEVDVDLLARAFSLGMGSWSFGSGLTSLILRDDDSEFNFTHLISSYVVKSAE